MRTNDGHTEERFEVGGTGEDGGFTIWYNSIHNIEYSKPCKHAGPIQTETMERTNEQLRGFRLPRLIVSYTQGGHDCTGVCLDCVIEATRS
jgi:hypothetical protein